MKKQSPPSKPATNARARSCAEAASPGGGVNEASWDEVSPFGGADAEPAGA